jgi:hypothetical protein
MEEERAGAGKSVHRHFDMIQPEPTIRTVNIQVPCIHKCHVPAPEHHNRLPPPLVAVVRGGAAAGARHEGHATRVGTLAGNGQGARQGWLLMGFVIYPLYGSFIDYNKNQSTIVMHHRTTYYC